MRNILAAILATTALGCAPAAAPQSVTLDGITIAQEVLAVERAYAERAQRDGQWTAFRATAAVDAIMFWPDPVPAAQVLANLPDPARSVRWQPHRVIVSCDGTMVATTGAAQYADDSNGSFTTIWARQADGGWRWVADYGDNVASPIPEPATPQVEVAECPGSEGPDPAALSDDIVGGWSNDGTLTWDWMDTPASRGLRVTMWIGPRYAPTILPGPPAPASPR